MGSSVKLLSLNIEGDKHLELVIPFIKKENADVVCLQEVLEKDIEKIKQGIYSYATYTPMLNDTRYNTSKGMLTLSKFKFDEESKEYYEKMNDTLPIIDLTNPNVAYRLVMSTKITKDNEPFHIINTHFTWSGKGEPTAYQAEKLDAMMQILNRYEEFVICGDFNLVRGKGLWEKMAEKYTDNIPQNITTTIDQNLHKVKNIQYVVDGMFSTKGYTISDVQVIGGVSDHMAVVGNIQI